MLPPKRTKRKKTNKLVETSTQTDPNFIFDKTNLSFLAPVVVLEKLDLNLLHNRSVIQEEQEQELSSSSSYLHSHETTSNKTSSQVMTAPNNYSVFAQPINNNQKANSTLASAGSTRRRRRDSLAPFPKAKKAAKAGPLCYKKKCLENNEEDLNIPIMLGSSKSPRNLHTILERSLEQTPPLLPPINNPRVDGVCGNDIGLQTNFTSIEVFENCTDILNIDVPIMDHLEQEEEISINRPDNVRFKCGGVTTVISTKSQHSDDDDDDEAGNEAESRKKYIKINAKTVHIHNHFYNNA